MFTRCPDCHTVHPLNAALLATAEGSVRCGRCKKKFSALEALYDHWPGPGDKPVNPSGSEPPTLGMRLDKDAESESGDDAPAEGLALAEQVTGQRARVVLIAVAAVLLPLFLFNLVWTFRAPLLEQPELRSLAESVGWVDAIGDQRFRDPSLVRLVSRDMHVHPTQSGVLILNATLVNRAQQPQPYPQLEVTLLNADNQPLATRVFTPTEYLEPGTDPSANLAPEVYLPLLLELVDPGEQAVGFQLEFL